MEGSSSESDDDRQIDRKSFQREQFDIFKHNFREAYDESYGAEDLESTIKGVGLKREAINLLRRLQKAEDSLGRAERGDELAKRIRSTREELSNLLKPMSTEFAPTNLRLPRFNRDEMELLLGEGTVSTERDEQEGAAVQPHIVDNKSPEDAFKWISESNRSFEARVEALMRDGQQALQQCE